VETFHRTASGLQAHEKDFEFLRRPITITLNVRILKAEEPELPIPFKCTSLHHYDTVSTAPVGVFFFRSEDFIQVPIGGENLRILFGISRRSHSG